MATTQDGRSISIKTPLAKDFLLLNRVSVSEAISELFVCDVELLHEENEKSYQPTDVDVKALLGNPVTITLTQDDGTSRNLSGIINSFSKGDRTTRFSYYHATIVPHVWLLTQNIQSRIFQHKSVPDVLQEVLEGFEVSFEIQGSFSPRNYIVQYGESDYNFICRLMEEEGIYFYFDHSKGLKMVVANTPQSHQNLPSKEKISYYLTDSAENAFEPKIKDLWIDYKLQSGKITYRDRNFELATNNLEVQQPSIHNVGDNQTLEIYQYPGTYAKRFDGVDRTGGDATGNLQNIFADKQRTAETSMNALDAQYKVLSGYTDCCSMISGHRFTLEDHPTKELNAQYVITKLNFEAEQSPPYISDDDELESYSASFSCIPHGAGATPFRPQKRSYKPVMRGSQTATVVGPSGEEIFTDKYGRVKVQFHWDRHNKFDADSSCWVRVAKDLAGNKYGSMYIPRIGHEVIVDFLEGDPDQPIITGSVYNPETMPHYELPKFKTLTYIKTRTSPDDGKGFNELRFEDKQGKEQVFIHSQKRMDTRVRGSFYETCGGNRQERIGVRTDNQPGGNLAITVGGNYDLHVKEAQYIGIDDKLNEAVKADVVEDYQGKQQTLVSGKRELNAQQIILEASQKISLKVGGNCIVIDSSGITIAGTMVKINSGGFGVETGNPSIDDPLDAASADTGEPGYLDRPRTGGGSRGRNRRQLTSQHYVAPPRPGEDARITAMRNTLADSAQGRHALEVYDRYGVDPSFRGGEGSYFDGTNNNMNLDPTEDPTTSALTFTHEMQHAEENHEGTTGDVNNQTRNEYVDEMLQEEVDGTVRSIEARNELDAAGHDVSNSHFPLENEYQQAHDQAIVDAQAANPNLSEDELADIGREAGRQRVEDGFRNGEVVTSTNGQSYPDYYGDDWDNANPGP